MRSLPSSLPSILCVARVLRACSCVALAFVALALAARAAGAADRGPGRRTLPARMEFYNLVTGQEIAAFEPGLSVGFEGVLVPERPYGPEVCGSELMTAVDAKLELFDGDSVVATYGYRNQIIPWDAGEQAALHAHFDAWVDPSAERPERRDAWEFRAYLFSHAVQAKAYALRAAIVVTCGGRAPVTLAEGTLPWDLRGQRLRAFQERLERRETMTASYNRLRPPRRSNAALERRLLALLRRQGGDVRRLVVLGDWSVQRDASGAPLRRALRAQVASRDRRRGGFRVNEVAFEETRIDGGRAWGRLRYAGPTGAADFPILRRNLRR